MKSVFLKKKWRKTKGKDEKVINKQLSKLESFILSKSFEFLFYKK